MQQSFYVVSIRLARRAGLSKHGRIAGVHKMRFFSVTLMNLLNIFKSIPTSGKQLFFYGLSGRGLTQTSWVSLGYADIYQWENTHWRKL